MAICAAKNVSRRIILVVALTYFRGGKAEDSIRRDALQCKLKGEVGEGVT